MKVSECEISRQIKVSKTFIPNTIKNFIKKVFSRTAKKQPIQAFLAIEINVLQEESESIS